MKCLSRPAAALTLLLFAAGGAFAAPSGPPQGHKLPRGPVPVRINNAMPAVRQNGGPKPGGPGQLARPLPPGQNRPSGPGQVRPGGPQMGPRPVRPLPPRPNMAPGVMRPPLVPVPRPNYRAPVWHPRPQPYYGPGYYRKRDNDDTGKIVLGVIGGLIIGGMLSSAMNSSN
ncbi:hypothetical protein [Cloacibacillus sp.]